MRIFKVVKKKKKDQAFWEDTTYLIVASNYANAEDKAKNFGDTEANISYIQEVGSTTNKVDVFLLSERL